MTRIDIPVSAPDLRGREAEYVLDAVSSTWISSSGSYLDRFSELFAESCGVPTAIPVANGTVALHLILAALGIGPGDEVIVPSLTYIASVNAISYTGATPVFADVDMETWTLDPRSVAQRVSPRTRAVMAVHLYGQPADTDALSVAAPMASIVEDAAEATFATYRGRTVGSIGRAAAFSFFGNKIISCGEGGAVTTADSELAERMWILRGQGMDPKRRYYHPVIGYNYRLTNVAAAILCAQMERREELLARRQEVSDLYREGLGDLQGLAWQSPTHWAEPVTWLHSLRVTEEAPITRDALMAWLAEGGVDTRPFFFPVHLMPPHLDQDLNLPNTALISAQGLNLPTSSVMATDDVTRVIQLVRQAWRR